MGFTTEKMYDVVNIYNGWSLHPNNLLANLSGDIPHKTLASETNRVLVVFTSDHLRQLKGFRASWKAGMLVLVLFHTQQGKQVFLNETFHPFSVQFIN